MRIIAGLLRGRQFKSPPGRRSHPMSEKMRGALFNVLGDIAGLRVLDAYSGSGAVSFEAASRGAKHVWAIEKSVLAYRTIKKNIESLNLEGIVRVSRANASTWSSNNTGLQFDIVVCDPPYDAIRTDSLSTLTNHVSPNGVFVLSWPGSEEAPVLANLAQIKLNHFGDSQLVFYKKTG